MERLFRVMFAVVVCACAAAPPPRPTARVDPSNPDAPQSKPLPVSTALAPEPSSAGDAPRREQPEGHRHGAEQDGARGSSDAAADYTCPMHPEISQPGPGRCPKCGMPLVERKQEAAPESPAEPGAREQEHDHQHGAPR